MSSQNYVSAYNYNVTDVESTFTVTHVAKLKFANTLYRYHGICKAWTEPQIRQDESKKDDKEEKEEKWDVNEIYDVIVFGAFDANYQLNFISSLKWLSVHQYNDPMNIDIKCNVDKTRQFQKFPFLYQIHEYYAFGYVTCKHFLILCGGYVGKLGMTIDTIFYFDFLSCTWYKSEIVECNEFSNLRLSEIIM